MCYWSYDCYHLFLSKAKFYMFDANFSEENVQITSSFPIAGNSCIYLCNQNNWFDLNDGYISVNLVWEISRINC